MLGPMGRWMTGEKKKKHRYRTKEEIQKVLGAQKMDGGNMV